MMGWYLDGVYEGMRFDQLGHVLADFHNAINERWALCKGTEPEVILPSAYDGWTRAQVKDEIETIQTNINLICAVGIAGEFGKSHTRFAKSDSDGTYFANASELLEMGDYGSSWIVIGDGDVTNPAVYYQIKEAIQGLKWPVYNFTSAGNDLIDRRHGLVSGLDATAREAAWDAARADTIEELNETTWDAGFYVWGDSYKNETECYIRTNLRFEFMTKYIRGTVLKSKLTLAIGAAYIFEWRTAPTFRISLLDEEHEVYFDEVFISGSGEYEDTWDYEFELSGSWNNDGTNTEALIDIYNGEPLTLGIPEDDPIGDMSGNAGGGWIWCKRDAFGTPPYDYTNCAWCEWTEAELDYV